MVCRLSAPLRDRTCRAGATVITDAWQGYSGISELGYVHHRRSQRARGLAVKIPANCCPACTESPPSPNGGCSAPTRGGGQAHLDSYLNEFVFRFNRRNSHSRGLSSTGCSSSPSAMSPCDTATSSSVRGHGRSHPRRQGEGAPAEPGPSPIGPPLAGPRPAALRLNGEPVSQLWPSLPRQLESAVLHT